MAKLSLEEVLEKGSGGEILLLGRLELFSKEEIENFLSVRDLSLSCEYSLATLAVVEGRGLKMPEELLSEQAYSDGIAHYRLEELEKIISATLKPDEVLMALKLGKDKERLLRLLSNEYLSDDFFLRLLRLYEWEGSELMDSEQDRKVLIALMQRFLKLSIYEQDALHSPATLLRLIRTTNSPRVLEALLDLPSFEFRVGKRRRISIPQAIAMRSILNQSTLKRLLRYRDESIDWILASNPSLSKELQNHLWKQRASSIGVALASNPSLNEELFEELLQENEDIVKVLLESQPIDTLRFKKILDSCSSDLLLFLGSNTLLSREVAKKLSSMPNSELQKSLASNEGLDIDILNTLFEKEELHIILAKNSAIDETLAKKLFDIADPKILEALSANPATPEYLLQKLYDFEHFDYLKGLASNPSTPMSLLHQLKTDHRLWLILQKNETFVKEANREMGMR